MNWIEYVRKCCDACNTGVNPCAKVVDGTVFLQLLKDLGKAGQCKRSEWQDTGAGEMAGYRWVCVEYWPSVVDQCIQFAQAQGIRLPDPMGDWRAAYAQFDPAVFRAGTGQAWIYASNPYSPNGSVSIPPNIISGIMYTALLLYIVIGTELGLFDPVLDFPRIRQEAEAEMQRFIDGNPNIRVIVG